MNITLDGMNNNSQRFKSGGTSFYTFAPERLDAIEEVTVSTSGMNADQSGDGAMNIRFTTKRGTDKYHFHVLEQFSNEDLNANSWFNNARGIARSRSRSADYAGNMGGPLLPWIHPLKEQGLLLRQFRRCAVTRLFHRQPHGADRRRALPATTRILARTDKIIPSTC